MPTYDYVCDACNHGFEEFQAITAKPLRKCPSCGKPKLRRLLGAGAGVIFKGGGFYQTDYRSESYKKAAEAESKSSTPPADSSSKSDSSAATPGSDKSAAKSADKAAKSDSATSHAADKPPEKKKPPSSKK